MVYELKNVGYERHNKWLVKEINLKLTAGTFVSIIGPNGAGKSTLLKLFSGEFKNSTGTLLLNQVPIHTMSPLQLAEQRAFLSQMGSVNFPYRVIEIVAMGLIKNYAPDAKKNKIESSMQLTDSTELAERIYSTLSGGEMKKADLTRVLLQETKILLLDEPTNHLDIKHQIQLLSLCRKLTESGYTIIAAMHDVNLAAAFSDHVVVLKYGKLIADGYAKEVLNKELIQEVYQVPCDVIISDSKPVIIPRYF